MVSEIVHSNIQHVRPFNKVTQSGTAKEAFEIPSHI